jgi:hypothetical protein
LRLWLQSFTARQAYEAVTVQQKPTTRRAFVDSLVERSDGDLQDLLQDLPASQLFDLVQNNNASALAADSKSAGDEKGQPLLASAENLVLLPRLARLLVNKINILQPQERIAYLFNLSPAILTAVVNAATEKDLRSWLRLREMSPAQAYMLFVAASKDNRKRLIIAAAIARNDHYSSLKSDEQMQVAAVLRMTKKGIYFLSSDQILEDIKHLRDVANQDEKLVTPTYKAAALTAATAELRALLVDERLYFEGENEQEQGNSRVQLVAMAGDATAFAAWNNSPDLHIRELLGKAICLVILERSSAAFNINLTSEQISVLAREPSLLKANLALCSKLDEVVGMNAQLADAKAGAPSSASVSQLRDAIAITLLGDPTSFNSLEEGEREWLINKLTAAGIVQLINKLDINKLGEFRLEFWNFLLSRPEENIQAAVQTLLNKFQIDAPFIHGLLGVLDSERHLSAQAQATLAKCICAFYKHYEQTIPKDYQSLIFKKLPADVKEKTDLAITLYRTASSSNSTPSLSIEVVSHVVVANRRQADGNEQKNNDRQHLLQSIARDVPGTNVFALFETVRNISFSAATELVAAMLHVRQHMLSRSPTSIPPVSNHRRTVPYRNKTMQENEEKRLAEQMRKREELVRQQTERQKFDALSWQQLYEMFAVASVTDQTTLIEMLLAKPNFIAEASLEELRNVIPAIYDFIAKQQLVAEIDSDSDSTEDESDSLPVAGFTTTHSWRAQLRDKLGWFDGALSDLCKVLKPTDSEPEQTRREKDEKNQVLLSCIPCALAQVKNSADAQYITQLVTTYCRAYRSDKFLLQAVTKDNQTAVAAGVYQSIDSTEHIITYSATDVSKSEQQIAVKGYDYFKALCIRASGKSAVADKAKQLITDMVRQITNEDLNIEQWDSKNKVEQQRLYKFLDLVVKYGLAGDRHGAFINCLDAIDNKEYHKVHKAWEEQQPGFFKRLFGWPPVGEKPKKPTTRSSAGILPAGTGSNAAKAMAASPLMHHPGTPPTPSTPTSTSMGFSYYGNVLNKGAAEVLADSAVVAEAKAHDAQTWATSVGIFHTLQQQLGESVHLPNPELGSVAGLYDTNPNVATAAAASYAKAVAGYQIARDAKVGDTGFIKHGGQLTKPIVMVLNTGSAKAADSKDTTAMGGAHWRVCVILPKNYITSAGVHINNSKERIFVLDSLHPAQQELPVAFKKLLTQGGQYTFSAPTSERDSTLKQYVHTIPAAFPNAEFVQVTNFPKQQVGTADCGWWAVHNAIQIVTTGSADGLTQQGKPRPASDLRVQYPDLAMTDAPVVTISSKGKSSTDVNAISSRPNVEFKAPATDPMPKKRADADVSPSVSPPVPRSNSRPIPGATVRSSAGGPQPGSAPSRTTALIGSDLEGKTVTVQRVTVADRGEHLKIERMKNITLYELAQALADFASHELVGEKGILSGPQYDGMFSAIDSVYKYAGEDKAIQGKKNFINRNFNGFNQLRTHLESFAIEMHQLAEALPKPGEKPPRPVAKETIQHFRNVMQKYAPLLVDGITLGKDHGIYFGIDLIVHMNKAAGILLNEHWPVDAFSLQDKAANWWENFKEALGLGGEVHSTSTVYTARKPTLDKVEAVAPSARDIITARIQPLIDKHGTKSGAIGKLKATLDNTTDLSAALNNFISSLNNQGLIGWIGDTKNLVDGLKRDFGYLLKPSSVAPASAATSSPSLGSRSS